MTCSSSSRRHARIRALSVVAGVVGLTACGHVGLDFLPGAEDETDGGATGDLADASISADGADGAVDARADAGVCQGSDCPGTYVSGDTGDDGNPGTSEKPVKTIAKGIEIAAKLGGPTSVYIAARAGGAKYLEKVVLVEGVSLIGGYACTADACTWSWPVTDPPTAIGNVDFRGVVAGDDITRATVIDSLWIMGKGSLPDLAPGAAALTIDRGAPTVRRCRLDGPPVTGGTTGARRSIGVAILGPPPASEPLGPLLEENTVRSGTSTEDSFAILIGTLPSAPSGATAAAVIKGNNIRSGQGLASAGIVGWDTRATTRIEGNSISAGASIGGPFGSWAISVTRGMVVERNLINVEANSAATGGPSCTGDTFCGGIRSTSSAAVIRSNLIRGARAPYTTAVLLGAIEGVPGAVVLNGNTLDPAGSGGDPGGGTTTVSSAIVLRNTLGNDAVVGTVRNNILLGGTNALRYGVYEEKVSNKTVHLIALDNNAFWSAPRANGAGDFAYRSWDGQIAKDYAFADLASLATPVPSANLGVDPLLDATFHLKPGSPMVDKGTPTGAPPHDIDGEGRPKGAGIDIGADESK